MTDTPVKRYSLSLTKDTLSTRLAEIVYDSLNRRLEKCGRLNDTFQALIVTRSYISNEVRILNDTMKLGTIYIPSQNDCFNATGSAYGGGTLHFVIFKNKEIKLLNTNTELIDIADYDHDGNPEYIFITSWFNSYGYIMYYNNFHDQVCTTWSYH